MAVWINLLQKNRVYLDLCCVAPDGSHTPAKNGGDAVGYQGRKAARTIVKEAGILLMVHMFLTMYSTKKFCG